MKPEQALAVLGLEPGASTDEIDAAHRRLAARTDPARWADAGPDEQALAAERRAEVDAAYVVLRGHSHLPAVRASAAVTARRSDSPLALPAAPGAETSGDGVEGEPAPGLGAAPSADSPDRLPRGLLILLGVILAVVGILAAVGLSSPARDGSEQRRVLGPLAHRYWEAEYRRDYGALWDVSERSVKTSVDRAGFIAHMQACPKRVPPRTVYRIAKRPDGLWEVEARSAGEYLPTGLTVFREEEPLQFAAVIVDRLLLDFLAEPLPEAISSGYCSRP